MARRPPIETRVSPKEVIEAAKKAIGTTFDRDLARRMADYGFDEVSTADAIGRWKREQHQPEYAPAIVLLEIAGWLNEDAIRRAEGLAGDTASASAREAMAAGGAAVDRARDTQATRQRGAGEKR